MHAACAVDPALYSEPPQHREGNEKLGMPSVQHELYLIHGTRRLLVLFILVKAADAAHLVAVIRLATGIIHAVFRGILRDVLCASLASYTDCEENDY